METGNCFARLLLFLEDQKSVLVRIEQLLPSKPWIANALERPNSRGKLGDAPVDHRYVLCPKAPTKKDAANRENKTEEKRGSRGVT